VDFFGVVAFARYHCILFVVLTASWAFAESWFMTFSFTERLFQPVLRMFVVTAATGLLSFPAGWFSDVDAVFKVVASIAVIGVWALAILQFIALVSPHVIPTLEHPLLIKHTTPLLTAQWFVQLRKAYNDAYQQAFRERVHAEQGYEEPRGPHDQTHDPPPNRDDGRITYERALEIMELSDGANEQDIRSAYNRLMQKVHPDLGGSNFFAKQLNAAREVLLERIRR